MSTVKAFFWDAWTRASLVLALILGVSGLFFTGFALLVETHVCLPFFLMGTLLMYGAWWLHRLAFRYLDKDDALATAASSVITGIFAAWVGLESSTQSSALFVMSFSFIMYGLYIWWRVRTGRYSEVPIKE